MTNVKDLTKTLGEAWCFLKPSFVSQRQACLTLSPQVIPQVKKNGAALSKSRLEQWMKGTREAPPQPTMTQNDWPALFAKLYPGQTILPADKAKSPDCMFKFKGSVLCFQAKAGKQDLKLNDLKREIAKCPFLSLDEEVLILI